MSAAVATSSAAGAPIELAVMQPRRTMEQHFAQLAAYAKATVGVAPSVPSFPAPQILTDPDDPPVWPRWDLVVPPCVHDTTGSDVYGVGPHLNHFEEHVANLFGKHAGMFSVSGSMAQLIALKIHSTGKNAIFACHPKSHILIHQDRAFESLMGFSCLSIGPPARPLTAADVESACGKHWKQPACLVVELPDRELGAQTTTWKDLVAIREYTQSKGIKLHLDGARIWEIQHHYKKSFQEIAGLFDSVYVSFYKGLQGSTGAMLLGSPEFIRDARTWQWRFGGRIYQSFPLALEAERCLNENVNGLGRRGDKMREVVAALTAAQADFIASHQNEKVWDWMKEQETKEKQRKKNAAAAAAASAAVSKYSVAESADSAASSSPPPAASPSTATTAAAPSSSPFHPFFSFTPPTPTCAMVHMYLHCPSSVANSLRDAVANEDGISVYDRVRAEGKHSCYFEWTMGTANSQIGTEVFVKGWTRWMDRRYEQLKKAMQDSA